jgi:hypothetical protein
MCVAFRVLIFLVTFLIKQKSDREEAAIEARSPSKQYTKRRKLRKSDSNRASLLCERKIRA